MPVADLGFEVNLQGIGSDGATEFLEWASGEGSRRHLLDSLAFPQLLQKHSIQRFAETVLGSNCFPVAATLFAKSPDENWLVPWHQDVNIAVAEMHEVAGFGAWSVKGGICYVQPPVFVMEGLLAVRIHLDRATSSGGTLRVLPATHMGGRLTEAEIGMAKARVEPMTIEGEAGSVMLMRPLLLHASSKRTDVDGARRVLHVEFAAAALPSPLRWRYESPWQSAIAKTRASI